MEKLNLQALVNEYQASQAARMRERAALFVENRAINILHSAAANGRTSVKLQIPKDLNVADVCLELRRSATCKVQAKRHTIKVFW